MQYSQSCSHNVGRAHVTTSIHGLYKLFFHRDFNKNIKVANIEVIYRRNRITHNYLDEKTE